MSGIPLRKLAAREGHAEHYMASVIKMISPSPKIQSAIMDGTQPVDLSLESLMHGPIPLDWSEIAVIQTGRLHADPAGKAVLRACRKR